MHAKRRRAEHSPAMAETSQDLLLTQARQSSHGRRAAEVRLELETARETSQLMWRIEVWAAGFRIAVALSSTLVALLYARKPSVVAVCVSYALLASLVPYLTRVTRFSVLRSSLLTLMVVLDVGAVTIVSYLSGFQVSPAHLTYLPLVVGWSLVLDARYSYAALALVIASSFAVVLGETWGWLSHPLLSGQPVVAVAPGGPAVFLAVLTASFVAVHQAVRIVSKKLIEHGKVIASLRTAHSDAMREAEFAAISEESDRLAAMARLAGGVAHDLNNVLMVILCATESLNNRPYKSATLPEGQSSAMRELVAKSVQRASALSALLLDMAGRRPGVRKVLDLSTLTREVVAAQAQRFSSHTLGQDIPDDACNVLIDRAGYERVLVALIEHGVEATPLGREVRIALRRELGPDGFVVVLEVHDGANTLDQSQLRRVFEPFVEGARGSNEGLRLAAAAGIVRQNGGQIEAVPHASGGNAYRASFVASAVQASEVVNPSSITGDHGGTVVVVDDEPDVRLVVTRNLEAIGYRVLAADGASRALELVREGGKIDLVLSDVSMPGMDGVELARALSAFAPSVPVILMTGHSANALSMEHLPSNICTVLGKPFGAARLATTVREVLSPGKGRGLPARSSMRA